MVQPHEFSPQGAISGRKAVADAELETPLIHLEATSGFADQADLWHSGLLCDVLLAAGGSSPIAAHRFVLAAASGYFRALFTGAGTSMRPLVRAQLPAAGATQARRDSDTADVVELPDLDPATLRTVLAAIYERSIAITPDNLESILSAGSYLEAPCLIAACCQYMRGALELTTAVPLLTLASRYGCLALRSELLGFIGNRFSSLLAGSSPPSPATVPPTASASRPATFSGNSSYGFVVKGGAAFTRPAVSHTAASAAVGEGTAAAAAPHIGSLLAGLPKELLLELLCNDELAVECESDVLQGVVDWVVGDPAVRLADLPDLVAAVRTDLLPSEPHLACSTEVHAAVFQHAKDVVARQRRRSSSSSCGGAPSAVATASSAGFAGGSGRDSQADCSTSGRGGGGSSSSCPADSFLTSDWRPSFGRPRTLCATSILAAGGHDASWRGLRSVELYDPHLDSWSLGPTMAAGVSFAACAALGREVYLFGGTPMCPYASRMTGGPDRVWEQCPPLPTPRAHSSVVACAGQVFVLGGRSQVQQVQCVLRRADVLDPLAGRWTSLPDMSVPRSALAAASLGGAIYVVGGQSSKTTQRSAERLDLGAGGCWTPLGSDMMVERKYTAASVVGGRLVVVGGVNEARTRLASAEALDPREGRWRALAPMRLPRSSCGAAVLHGKLYVVGGNTGASDEVLAGMECYVPAADKWLACAPLGCARSGLALCAV